MLDNEKGYEILDAINQSHYKIATVDGKHYIKVIHYQCPNGTASMELAEVKYTSISKGKSRIKLTGFRLHGLPSGFGLNKKSFSLA